jgi:hypothetical protein
MALRRLASILYYNGIKTLKFMPPWNSPYDLLVNGKVRCELKVSEAKVLQKHHVMPFWQVNLARHGKISHDKIDIYAICCLTNRPDKKLGSAIWLMIPASEIGPVKSFRLSIRSMAKNWGKWISNFEYFDRGSL